MKKLFKYLRRQPKSTRDNYALLFSGAFVLLVLTFWLPTQWGNDNTEKVAEATVKKELPFKTLFKSIKEQFAAAVTSVSGETVVLEPEKTETINVHQGATEEFVLTEAEIATMRQKIEETETESVVPESGTYQQVLIATTSATTSVNTEAD